MRELRRRACDNGKTTTLARRVGELVQHRLRAARRRPGLRQRRRRGAPVRHRRPTRSSSVAAEPSRRLDGRRRSTERLAARADLVRAAGRADHPAAGGDDLGRGRERRHADEAVPGRAGAAPNLSVLRQTEPTAAQPGARPRSRPPAADDDVKASSPARGHRSLRPRSPNVIVGGKTGTADNGARRSGQHARPARVVHRISRRSRHIQIAVAVMHRERRRQRQRERPAAWPPRPWPRR